MKSEGRGTLQHGRPVWANDVILLGQDQSMYESQDYGEEKLSSTDVGVIGWRNFARQNARGMSREAHGSALAEGEEGPDSCESARGSMKPGMKTKTELAKAPVSSSDSILSIFKR